MTAPLVYTYSRRLVPESDIGNLLTYGMTDCDRRLGMKLVTVGGQLWERIAEVSR